MKWQLSLWSPSWAMEAGQGGCSLACRAKVASLVLCENSVGGVPAKWTLEFGHPGSHAPAQPTFVQVAFLIQGCQNGDF